MQALLLFFAHPRLDGDQIRRLVFHVRVSFGFSPFYLPARDQSWTPQGLDESRKHRLWLVNMGTSDTNGTGYNHPMLE